MNPEDLHGKARNTHCVTSPPTISAAPRAERDVQGRWVGGVASGIAANLGWPVALVRLGFVVLALAIGLGAIAYLAYWAVMPARGDLRRNRVLDLVRLAAFGLVCVGVTALAQSWGLDVFGANMAPLLLLALGLALLWQQWRKRDGVSGADEGPLTWIRPLVGVALVAVAVVALLVGAVGLVQGVRALTVIVLLAGALALLALPWLVGALRDLAQERRDRIRAQARAEIAVHVHDSVLQTLALIQANAVDSTEVARLARTEERRLRSWLYAPVGAEHSTLASSLRHEAARIEDDHGVSIDVVQVGDLPMTPQLEALIGAAGEAMVNAAKHGESDVHVTVYCEVDGNDVALYVRDRGPGFDPAAVPTDRHGVRDSIVGRMQRVGGTAEIRSSQSGTEVTLSLRVAP